MENLAKLIVDVLYPTITITQRKELRLKQQYFFISASLQALIEKYKKKHGDIRKLHEKVVIQMNDTHPTVAVPRINASPHRRRRIKLGGCMGSYK